ncbi:MAG: hypothetical protein PF636_05725 [Actinomycetota bacterium]|nr:hypothetical protein [Actinomycetota bacterium]
MDPYTPIKGKCNWWRENLMEDDRYDTSIKDDDKRVACSCFVEGFFWEYRAADVPSNCPQNRSCRYYIRHS